jgi:flagellar basal body-associated protein FliL
MAFEPQTANQPLVNVRKGPTKVNIAMAIGVVIFLVVGIIYAVRMGNKTEHGEPVLATPAPAPSK